jgi:hypothetical protein
VLRSNRWCWMFLSLLGLFALVSGSASAQSQNLRWNLQKGQALKMSLKQDIDQKMEIPGLGPQEIPMKQEVDMTWSVVESDEESFTVEIVLSRMTMSMKSAFMNIEYDSDEPDSNPQMNESISKVLGKKILQKMNRRGEVLEVKLPPEMEGNSSGDGPSGDMIKQMNQQSALVFPEGPMTVGKSWESTMDMEMNGMKMKNKVTYRYDGTEKVNGKELHKFNMTNNMQVEGGPQGIEIEVKEQNNEGVLYFDNDSGRIVSTNQKQKMKLELNAQGQAIDQEIDSKSVLTVTPIDK